MIPITLASAVAAHCKKFPQHSLLDSFLKSLFLCGSLFSLGATAGSLLNPDRAIIFTFSNRNIAAEFLGFCILAGLYLYFTTSPGKFSKTLLASVALQLIHLGILGSRSVALGITLGFLLLASCLFPLLKRKKVGVLFLTILILALAFDALTHQITAGRFAQKDETHAERQISEVQKNKHKTGTIRGKLWKASLDLIERYPNGIGPNQFEAQVLPYLAMDAAENYERTAYQNPHNDFLRLLVEHGIFAGGIVDLAVLLTLAFLALKFYLHRFQTTLLLLVMMLYFSIQMFFQFPLLVPTSIWIFGALSGFILCEFGAVQNEALAPSPTWTYLSGLALLFIVSAHIYCIAVMSWLPSPNRVDQVCRYNLALWPACFDELRGAFFAGDSKKIIEVVDLLERRETYQPFVLKETGFALLSVGQTKRACEKLRMYDVFYESTSSVHKVVTDKCD